MLHKVQLPARARRVVVIGSALAIVGAGIAYASIPDGSGTINACVLKNVGTVRLIDTSKSGFQGRCDSRFETQVSWNSKGPTGAAGPQGDRGPTGGSGPKGDTGPTGARGPRGTAGPTGAAGANGKDGNAGPTGAAGPSGDTGPTGPAGADGKDGGQGSKGDTGPTGPAGPNSITGYQVLTASGPLTAHQAVRGTLTCPDGTVVISGGLLTDQAIGQTGTPIIQSGPLSDGRTWRTEMINEGDNTVNITFNVTCANGTAPGAAAAARTSSTSSAHVFTYSKAG